MTKQKSDIWGIFTLELNNIKMYEADTKNYEILKEYAKLVNAPNEIMKNYDNKILALNRKVEYINSILNSLYWKDKELLERCYIKRYSNKLAGRKFEMSAKSVNNRLGKYLKKHITPKLDINELSEVYKI